MEHGNAAERQRYNAFKLAFRKSHPELKRDTRHYEHVRALYKAQGDTTLDVWLEPCNDADRYLHDLAQDRGQDPRLILQTQDQRGQTPLIESRFADRWSMIHPDPVLPEHLRHAAVFCHWVRVLCALERAAPAPLVVGGQG